LKRKEIPVSDWRDLKAEIEAEIDRIWLEEPIEIQKIRWGVIDSGAGSGGQSFTVLVHLEAFLMIFGANVLYRLVRLAHDGTLDMPALRATTLLFLGKPFNVFEFMGDLGLPRLHGIGDRYVAALEGIETAEDYVAVTGALMTYVIRLHRWIHFYFPWNLGVAFPHRQPADFAAFVRNLGEAAAE
jgi:hypothetical protein